MRRSLLKRILVVLVPFLALAFTPIDFNYCKVKMRDCKGCPMMEKLSAGTPRVSSSRAPCCGSYHWEGLASFTSLVQKTGDFLKSPLPVLQSNALFDDILSSSIPFERREVPVYFHPPPPLFILNQSFLI